MATPDDLRRRVKCAGGFVPNNRGVLGYSSKMDEIDLQRKYDWLDDVQTSETKESFKKPLLKCGHPPASVCGSESGFSRADGTTSPEPWVVAKELANLTMECKDRTDANCRVPLYLRGSETKASYREFGIANANVPQSSKPGLLGAYPGQYSGFTRAYNPNTLDGRYMDPIWSGAVPDMGRVGPSTTHQDFLPIQVRTGAEHNLPINMTGRTVTSFNRTHELNPCYSDHAWKGPCRPDDFLTQYTTDYARRARCENTTANIMDKVFNKLKSEKRDDVNLFQGQGYYQSEAMERYTPPAPEGRARHGHLRGAVGNYNHTSGFGLSTQVHMPQWVPCPVYVPQMAQGPMHPQAYNPWPRHLVGHQVIVDKNYRPHPAQNGGVEYAPRQVENPSIFGPYPTIQ